MAKQCKECKKNKRKKYKGKKTKLFKKNPKSRKGFPEERHLLLPTKYGLTKANYCGPYTRLDSRLKRGDPPINKLDRICMYHDIDYSKAKDIKDIRKADKQMIKSINKLNKKNLVNQAFIAGFKAKIFAEKKGLLDRYAFAQNLKSKNVQ